MSFVNAHILTLARLRERMNARGVCALIGCIHEKLDWIDEYIEADECASQHFYCSHVEWEFPFSTCFKSYTHNIFEMYNERVTNCAKINLSLWMKRENGNGLSVSAGMNERTERKRKKLVRAQAPMGTNVSAKYCEANDCDDWERKNVTSKNA